MPYATTLPDWPRPPIDPADKMPMGPTDWADPDGRQAFARWLTHVEAGRIGGSLCRPTAALLEAGGLSDETRETILANERLMFGRQRTIIG